jgi:hypothetical protein
MDSYSEGLEDNGHNGIYLSASLLLEAQVSVSR